MLEEFDRKLILGFLTTNYNLFQFYLEANEIEGSEAEQILDKMKGEIEG